MGLTKQPTRGVECCGYMVKADTCKVDCGRRQGHCVCQGVEWSSILEPNNPDWFWRPVGHTVQAEGDIGHYRHVLGLNGEMR